MRSAARKTVVLEVGEEAAAAAPAPATVGLVPSRKKVGGGGLGRTWTWLVMSGAAGSEGEGGGGGGGGGGASEVVIEAGKHEIMRRTGVPARDLRILDPILSYPSTMLGRERAIVINLEHIKAIITAHEVLLLLPPPNPKSPSSPASSSALEPFIEDLRRRLLRQQPCAGDDDDGAMSDADADAKAPASTSAGMQPRSRSRSSSPPPPSNVLRNRNNPSSFASWEPAPPRLDQKHEREGSIGGPKVLPFEFCALEVCLEAACSSLESEVNTSPVVAFFMGSKLPI
jgi:magnesium transporter